MGGTSATPRGAQLGSVTAPYREGTAAGLLHPTGEAEQTQDMGEAVPVLSCGGRAQAGQHPAGEVHTEWGVLGPRYPSSSLRMLSRSFKVFQAWSFSFLVGVRFFCRAAMILRNASITSLSAIRTRCRSSCRCSSSLASLGGTGGCEALLGRPLPAPVPARSLSPQQLVLLGAVVCAERLQLCLPLAQLSQHLVL